MKMEEQMKNIDSENQQKMLKQKKENDQKVKMLESNIKDLENELQQLRDFE